MFQLRTHKAMYDEASASVDHGERWDNVVRGAGNNSSG